MKGGGKYDFRDKRKSTNYNLDNYNSAFYHIIGLLKGQGPTCSAHYFHYNSFLKKFQPPMIFCKSFIKNRRTSNTLTDITSS